MTLMSFKVFANDHNPIILKLDTLDRYNEFRYHTIEIPTAIKTWSVNKLEIDSILYECILQDKSGDITCKQRPLKMNILVKKDQDSIQISILKRLNYIIANDIILSYDISTIESWNKSNLVPHVEIDIPFCINNITQTERVDFYLIPHNMGINFQNEWSQQLPLLISMARYRKVDFEGYTLYFTKDDYIKTNIETTKIYVSKNDIYHVNEYTDMDGIKIDSKEMYHFGDTIRINNCFYKLCNITNNWDSVQICKISNVQQLEKLLPDNILQEVIPYFGIGKEHLLIDFWGTWCAPCIKELPELLKLYEKVQDKYNFVSICFDESSNFERAKQIFKKNNISWSQIFDNQSDNMNSITGKLGINTFPSFILIDRKGKILFKGEGQNGFEKIKKLLTE